MDAKLTENVIFVWGTGKDFVLQFIKLTFMYTQIIFVVLYMPYRPSLPAPIAQVVERPLRDREVAGSILGRAIPKA